MIARLGREVVAFSLWTDTDAIRSFAGEDIDAMVLYPEDQQYLIGPSTLVHCRVETGDLAAAPPTRETRT